MSEEEKKAIEKLKEYALCKVNDIGYVEVSANGYKHTILNLIENQQKELNNLKEIEKLHKEENGKLRVEFKKVYEDNLTLAKELEQYKLLEANIDKANKIIAKNKFDESLYGLLMKEKEKNKEIETDNIDLKEKNRLIVENLNRSYISKDKLKELLENEIIDISGFRCIAVEDIENLLEGK